MLTFRNYHPTLSPSSNYHVDLSLHRYASLELAMFAQHANSAHERVYLMEAISRYKNLAQARSILTRNKVPYVARLEDIKIACLCSALCNPDVEKCLLDSGDQEIIFHDMDMALGNGKGGMGANMLGKAWAWVRAERRRAHLEEQELLAADAAILEEQEQLAADAAILGAVPPVAAGAQQTAVSENLHMGLVNGLLRTIVASPDALFDRATAEFDNNAGKTTDELLIENAAVLCQLRCKVEASVKRVKQT